MIFSRCSKLFLANNHLGRLGPPFFEVQLRTFSTQVGSILSSPQQAPMTPPTIHALVSVSPPASSIYCIAAEYGISAANAEMAQVSPCRNQPGEFLGLVGCGSASHSATSPLAKLLPCSIAAAESLGWLRRCHMTWLYTTVALIADGLECDILVSAAVALVTSSGVRERHQTANGMIRIIPPLLCPLAFVLAAAR